MSRDPPPVIVSSPALPQMTSKPPSPAMTSVPPLPSITSRWRVPTMWLRCFDPVMVTRWPIHFAPWTPGAVAPSATKRSIAPEMLTTPGFFAQRFTWKPASARWAHVLIGNGLRSGLPRPLDGPLKLARLPTRAGQDRPLDHAALVALDDLEHRAQELLAQVVRLEAEVVELRVGSVVVVALGLDPGIRIAVDGDLVAELGPASLDELGELGHRELLGELVEHPELTEVSGVVRRQLHALKRVADVQEPAGLATLAVDRERMADHRLHAEPIQNGPEVFVVVEAGDQPFVGSRLLRLDPVDNALV